MKAAVRHAEADRVSSCAFADRVAELSLQQFRSACPEELKNTYKQTVIATFLMHNEDDSTAETMRMPLQVVSIGVGTKFLPWTYLAAEQTKPLKQRFRIKDCHAEVLARRGLQIYLLAECQRALGGVRDGTDTSLVVGVLPDGTFSLRPGVRLHFYSSSTPCGNSAIKKWAKGKKPTLYPDLAPHVFPLEAHNRMHVTARAEGQVALLVKRSRTIATTDASLEDSGSERVESHKIDIDSVFPPGTASVDSCCGVIMTCSDKIAKWNALGVQGGLLSSLFRSPIYISTCTVGRKYSRPILERALCCRLQDFEYPTRSKPQKRRCVELSAQPTVAEIEAHCKVELNIKGRKVLYQTHHPTMLSTSVKFDDSAIATGLQDESQVDQPVAVGASFTEPLCLVGALGVVVTDSSFKDRVHVEKQEINLDVIDSRNGLSISPLGSASEACWRIASRYSGQGIYKSFLRIVQFHKAVFDSTTENDMASSEAISTLPKEHNLIKELYAFDAPPSATHDELALSYAGWKQAAVEHSSPLLYFEAKKVLLSDSKFFAGWVTTHNPPSNEPAPPGQADIRTGVCETKTPARQADLNDQGH